MTFPKNTGLKKQFTLCTLARSTGKRGEPQLVYGYRNDAIDLSMKHGPSLSYYAHTYGSKGDVPLDTMDQAQWTVFCGATGGSNATYHRNGVNVKYGEGAAESVPMGFALGFIDDAPYSWSVSDVVAWDRPLSKDEIAGQGGIEDKLMKRKNALMRGDVLMARQSDMASISATMNKYAAMAADAKMQSQSNPHPKAKNWLMW